MLSILKRLLMFVVVFCLEIEDIEAYLVSHLNMCVCVCVGSGGSGDRDNAFSAVLRRL